MDTNPILIGYVVKRIAMCPDWLKAAAVEEICSVAGCISDAIVSEARRWDCNGLVLFNDEGTALRSAADSEDAARLELFAYRLIPSAHGPNGAKPIAVGDLPESESWPPQDIDLSRDFDFLGYDCAATGWDRNVAGLGCSPLSCNCIAMQIPVNRHCLIGDREQAISTAARFGNEQPEPGTYFAIEVWRKRRGSPSP